MPEDTNNQKRVSNPLTIIAIFAGLAEVAGTVAVKLVSPELQSVFVWFVMGFPILLVLLFFATLNFNPTVLYAPSDFRDDESFLDVLAKKQKLTIDLQSIEQQLDDAKERIVAEAEAKVGSAGQKERAAIVQVINQQLGRIKDHVSTAKESADVLTQDLSNERLPQSALQARILALVSAKGEEVSLKLIAEEVGSSTRAVQRAADRLVDRNLLCFVRVNSEPMYAPAQNKG